MKQDGIFISYQMAEAILLLENFDLNSVEGRTLAEDALQNLKNRWLSDTLPGTTMKIGDKITGMQDVTIDDIVKASELAKQVETYTLENAGAFQYILVNNNGNYGFDFQKLDRIAALARKNNKKIIIDSAVVFGDVFPTKIADLDKYTIINLIGDYTKKLTDRYGDIIERIDVLNSVFKRKQISNDNTSEEFWIKIFGDNYGQEIIDIVRKNLSSYNPSIKLCWNEFYLTNSNYEQRKIDFLDTVRTISGLDVIGVQDRFMTGESLDYIMGSLDEIASIGRESDKEVCITEFSCSASSHDLKNNSIENINAKIQNIINTVKKYCSTNGIIKRIEGRLCDKFDCNHKELQDIGFDISTTGRTEIDLSEKSYSNERPFDEMSLEEANIYQQIKQKNQAIKEEKIQQKQLDNPRVKKLVPPNMSDVNSNNGFISLLILLVIVGLVCVALFMFVYMVIMG